MATRGSGLLLFFIHPPFEWMLLYQPVKLSTRRERVGELVEAPRAAYLQNVTCKVRRKNFTNCIQTPENEWNSNVALKNLLTHTLHAEYTVIRVEHDVYMMAEHSERLPVLKLCHFASPHDGHRTYY